MTCTPRRPRSRAPLARTASTVVFGAGLAAVACGGPPAAETPSPTPREAPAATRSCPLPLVFGQGEPRPVRVRIENRTADTLDVFLDRCWWYSWMASVPPGKYRQPELGGKLITYAGGLRFHAFDVEGARRYGTYEIPVEPRGILTLVLDEESRRARSSLDLYTLDGQTSNLTVGRWSVLPGSDRGFAMLQADPGLAIMTWSCVGREGMLSVSLPGRLDSADAEVRLRRNGEEFRTVGRWRVQDGFNDALVPPESAFGELRRWFGGEATVDLLVDDAGSRQVHRFDVAGLEEALGSLGCWDPLPGPAGGA